MNATAEIESSMPRKQANLSNVFRVESFKRATVTRPIVRLYRAPEHALKETSLSGSGVKPGERLVFAIDPLMFVSLTEAELLDALHAVIKRLRDVRGVANRPSTEALKVHRLKEEEGLTVSAIAKLFAKRWPDCTDVESRERRVKRYLQQVRRYDARAHKRQLAGLTVRQQGRQQAILKMLDELPPVEPTTD
jgi:hypothetical protein